MASVAPFQQLSLIHVHAAHPRVSGKRNKLGIMLGDFATAPIVFLLGEHDDRATLGRLVGKAGELSRICQFAFAHAVNRYEFNCLSISQRDRPFFVEKQRIHIARSLDRLSADRQDVVLLARSIPAMSIAKAIRRWSSE